jgi:multiple sugar transport system permease protein
MTGTRAVITTSARPRRRGRPVRARALDALHVAGLLVVLVATVFPFLWMVSTSLKLPAQVFTTPPTLFFTPTLQHYQEALFQYGVWRNLVNSLIVTGAVTLLAVALGTPAAYAIARFDFRGKRDLWFWFITHRMISPIVMAVPFFFIARQLGLLNTHLVLILIHLTFTLPIVVWITSDQFRTVPKELDEAAYADGANAFTTFFRVALPVAIPGVVVSAILVFIFSWNELLYALVLTRTATQTAPVVATAFLSGYELPWGRIMATSTLIVLPVVVFGLSISRHIVRGLTMGAVK